MEKGKFIVFEGLDNTGKSTVSKIIAIMLDAMGIQCKLTRHPGSTEVGSELRQLLKHSPHPIPANAQALMFAADNSIFMDQILKPELEKGTWVIGDRNNFISSMAYQIASGCALDELDRVHDATKQTAKIDLVLIFDCPVEERLRRRQLRESLEGKVQFDRFEDADMAYQRKLAACYKGVKDDTARLSKFMNDPSKVKIIDASRDLDEVIASVKEVIVAELLTPESEPATAS